MTQPDILLFISDQHGAGYCSWGSVPVDTPALNRLRLDGVSFEQAYTSCPLCGPARMSMMTSLLPDRTGIFNSHTALSDTIPCFTHALVEAGYETVLIGHMNFVGSDQRHGFTRRLAEDFVPPESCEPGTLFKGERGLTGTAEFVLQFFDDAKENGTKCSLYDRTVVETAMEYLEQEHEKPQFIVIGTHGTHFPYFVERRLYEKYLERVEKPSFFDMDDLPDYLRGFTILNRRIKTETVTEDMARRCLAAYCGQIERLDGQIGEVRTAFEAYCRRRNREAVFIYLSDHGDTVGERRMFGKTTFFDKSVRIPMLFAGNRVMRGRRITDPVSILDIGPTICELAGTRFDIGDGKSLAGRLERLEETDPSRLVVSQYVDQLDGEVFGCVMLRYRQYKYILYHGFEENALLFNMEKDPEESRNLAKEAEQMALWFRERAGECADFYRWEELWREQERNARWFKAYEEAISPTDCLKLSDREKPGIRLGSAPYTF